MPLPSASDLQTLSYVYDAEPVAGYAEDTTSLSYVFDGGPVYAQAGAGGAAPQTSTAFLIFF